ncbi:MULTISPECIES: hypothetical protein [Vibrio]|uniref:hypothetical protein n=1 Tax=Vibrio TaxID=662 RepID=UPI002075605E|nr:MULTISPECIES: hypothetical protein [Vibrio]USD35637.1 hypothetical protein J8Z27_22780 [Vibrio sp. SCSIO 43186]USD72761.1 hypothetical protein J4N41_22785 [Vibrio sp. SCSIO 43139]USD98966.1 hypothetical protein CTT30_23110 [Vibrio coralliilyticus]
MTAQSKTIDANEAPTGFYAVLKSELTNPTGDYPNICTHCDWRKQCCDPKTDLRLNIHRCMSDPLITESGDKVERNDGCSVVFKRIELS